MQSFPDKLLNKPPHVHLLAMAILSFLIVCVVLAGIDHYTNHNRAVYIPDVRGLQLEDAVPHLEENHLRYVVVDSIFSKEVTPGAIVELMPEADTKVKRNRIVSITVNARSEETALLPDVAEISFRQAYALLKARGFSDITYKYILGEFRDLAVGVEYEGRLLGTGTRVPLTAKLLLVISDGNTMPQDTTEVVPLREQREGMDGDENWF
jgi:beta-lactam-binding protein with PASTA domain